MSPGQDETDHCMWVPQKRSHICSYIDFFHKMLHDFEVKNPISNIKRIKLWTVS